MILYKTKCNIYLIVCLLLRIFNSKLVPKDKIGNELCAFACVVFAVTHY